MFELGGEVVEPALADNLMRLIAEGAGEDDEAADTELRAQAVSSYLALLEKPRLPDILLQVRAFHKDRDLKSRMPWEAFYRITHAKESTPYSAFLMHSALDVHPCIDNFWAISLVLPDLSTS